MSRRNVKRDRILRTLSSRDATTTGIGVPMLVLEDLGIDEATMRALATRGVVALHGDGWHLTDRGLAQTRSGH